jgi:hypothetical protein
MMHLDAGERGVEHVDGDENRGAWFSYLKENPSF